MLLCARHVRACAWGGLNSFLVLKIDLRVISHRERSCAGPESAAYRGCMPVKSFLALLTLVFGATSPGPLADGMTSTSENFSPPCEASVHGVRLYYASRDLKFMALFTCMVT